LERIPNKRVRMRERERAGKIEKEEGA